MAAGAASTILAYVFPADADMFEALAEEAARSLLEVGVAYPSDVAAGLALGRQAGGLTGWGAGDGTEGGEEFSPRLRAVVRSVVKIADASAPQVER